MIDQSDVLDSIEQAEKRAPAIPTQMPVLPLRDIVIYPYMIFPVLIGRASSLKAVAEALERDKFILVTSQRHASTEDAGFDDIHKVGTVAKILQVMRLPNNLLKVLVEGAVTAKIVGTARTEPYLEAKVETIAPVVNEKDRNLKALIRHATELFEEYVKDNRNLPPEVLGAFQNIEDPMRKLYYAAANVSQKVDIKQKILDAPDVKTQYYELVQMLSNELELLRLEVEIDTKVQDQIQKSQRKYFIQEQIRALQTELGDEDDGGPELGPLKEQLEKAELPEPTKSKVMEEFDRLKRTPSMSPEFSVNRTWLEWIANVPWSARTADDLDINHVQGILDTDHYDLEKPKERILEYISVLNLVGSMRGQILCFVGPPGVGKTSLAKSIARALGRNFVRMSLGGVRDEAEIRGHRRTYIGAMPGKIIQSMKRAGSTNPVILLDEIDKMSQDFRGDPSAALLEVLDPEQNSTFSDHYLEVDYDLSNVLFIATANVKYDIPAPLLDRLEVIELSSYLEPDKVQIAKQYIIPKQIERHGLQDFNITFTDAALLKIVREYTREAGVRNLEREIASVMRKLAKDIVGDVSKRSGKTKVDDVRSSKAYAKIAKQRSWKVDEKAIERLLRVAKFKEKEEEISDKVGVATGLAWTSMGGDTLPVEVTIMPGVERLTLTGKLGDVMKESAMAALSFLRSNAARFGLDPEFSKGKEIHVHVPEGAIPKDGPSAGITMTLALMSAASGRPLRGDVAMTGEVTLRGNVLPIGGLNEKLLAAKRAGMTTVMVPKDNKKDVQELSPMVTEGLTIVYVGSITDAIPVAFRPDAVKRQPSKTTRKR
ncbi:MAG: endopeptidase La [Ignavibacteria bacterium]|nr:endopeptidase La [Ignavibacteria bacterium]MBK6418165.1 endopeptidase La [Ignavibacteria bacterium]MBK7412464.1 endopeptidase La [Ignavibacteria bacterium]